MKPTIFVTVGLPASGKTFFTKQLAKDLDVFFLNCDLLRLSMYKKPTFKAFEHAVVYGAANFIVEQHAQQGHSIICNANFNFRKSREATRAVAKQNGMEFKIIWVKTPYDIVYKRIQARQHDIPLEKMVDPPLEVLAKQQRSLQEPNLAEEPVITIDGTIDYQQQLQQFYAQAEDLFVKS